MWSKKLESSEFTDDSMSISGEKICIKLGFVPQNELRYWPDNPRIYSIVHASEVPLDQKDIQVELLKRDHVKKLIQDIKHHGGLMDPMVVIDGTFEVVEGNSRLAAIRFLCQTDPIKFAKPRCQILPKSLSQEQIYSYLNQQHIQGKTQWSPYEQAGVVYRLREAGKDWDILKSQMNIGETKARQMYKTYKFMVDHDEDRPDRYSYYQVYLSNKKARDKRATDQRLDKRIVEEVQKGQVTAQEFRKMLPHVCDNSKQFNKFVSGKNSFLGAYEELEEDGKTKDLVVRLKAIQKQLASMNKSEFDGLESRATTDARYTLRRIKTQTENLLTKVFGEKS